MTWIAISFDGLLPLSPDSFRDGEGQGRGII